MNKDELMYNYVHGTDVYLYQRKDMFRINSDTSHLAHFMRIEADETILDIGTNNGALLLCAALSKPKKLYGIDIQEEACELARYNLETCGIDYEIICGDACDYPLPQVDVIVCNPPYFPYDETSNTNESQALKIARHECYLTLDDLCASVSKALGEKGRFYMVHRANRIQDILTCFSKHRLACKRIEFIYDQAKDEAIGILLEAYKDGKISTKIGKGIVNER